jgi:hypothetical protein
MVKLKQQSEQESIDSDVTDVADLMNQAYTACFKWFDLIALIDVQEAMEVVRNEEEY